MSNTQQFGKIGKLGFGYMRLPRKYGKFDMDQICKMADAFIESGGTYFDTAYVYSGSEEALCESVLKRYPRDKVQIATKMVMGRINSPEQVDEQFKTSLKRLGTDRLDFYLLHSLNAKSSEKAEKMGAWQFHQELKAKGLIKHSGFSFHGPAGDLEEILGKHPETEFVQLQINYFDWDNPEVQSRRLYEIAMKHNKPVIVMEPVKGGLLASDASPGAEVLRSFDPDASITSWALRFVAQLDGILVTLSGMSTYEQTIDNIATYVNLKPLSPDEQAIIDKAVEAISRVPRVACTSCKYCEKGCPSKIAIPELIDIYNNYLVHKTVTNQTGWYKMLTGRGGKAGDCTACRACEETCPQKLEIADTMVKISRVFD